MKKRINYGDNLFLLTLTLKHISAAARLNVDPGLFLDKLVEDLFFLDGTTHQIYDWLVSNPHLLDRLEHLKSVQTLSEAFSRLLDDLRRKDLPLGEHLGGFGEKFELLARSHVEIARQCGRIIQGASGQPPEESYTVSESEFKFLLSDTGEEPEA